MEMQISLKNTLKTARLSFDARLAEVLIARPDLTHTQIEKDFGISETVIRRVTKQFNIGARKRGPKPRKHETQQAREHKEVSRG
jgi:transposase